ncbi:hypothetical protein C8R47DRAFT_402631 [Mycena vitilis]|nr:hypothetical protein C8R47DRAFT_402631 [Mycena vitilis]
MKSATTAHSSRFSPYTTPLPPRPSTMTARNGAHLRAAQATRDAPLNKWLSDSVTPESTSLPDRAPDADEALCVVLMTVLKGAVEDIFQDPDVYCLSLIMEVQMCPPSPLLRLARFVGSSDDADAPAWTRLLQPDKSHYFLQPHTFSAEMICGMTGIHVESISSGDISPRMCVWARTVSAGTRVEDDIDAHCRWLNEKDPEDKRKPGAPRACLVRRASPVKPKQLAAAFVASTRSTKLVHRVTRAPIRKVPFPPFFFFHGLCSFYTTYWGSDTSRPLQRDWHSYMKASPAALTRQANCSSPLTTVVDGAQACTTLVPTGRGGLT